MKNKNPMVRLILQAVVLSVFLLLCAAVVAAVILWSKPPQYWQKQQHARMNQPAEQFRKKAESVSRKFQGVWSAASPDDPASPGITAGHVAAGQPGTKTASGNASPSSQPQGKTPAQPLAKPIASEHELHLTTDEINAWIEQELPAILKAYGVSLPPEIRMPMIAIDGDKLILAFRYESNQTTQVLSLIVKPSMPGSSDKRKLLLEIQGLRGGRLPLPSDSLLDTLSDMAGTKTNPGMKPLADVLSGKPIDPVISLRPSPDQPATGTVRLLDFKLTGEGIDLKLRVQPQG